MFALRAPSSGSAQLSADGPLSARCLGFDDGIANEGSTVGEDGIAMRDQDALDGQRRQ